MSQIRTELEACAQGGVAWTVYSEIGELGRGVAFDGEAALAAANVVVETYRAHVAAVLGSLQEFSGQVCTDELVVKIQGRINALLAIFGELA